MRIARTGIARTAFTLALALLIGTCAACGTSPPPPASYAAPQRAEQLESKTVALVAPLVARAYCSGVWVSDYAFLTANHCMGKLDLRDTVMYATRADVPVDTAENIRVGLLIARDEPHDLALVWDPGAPTHASARVSDGVVIGQTAESMGHPLGLWWSYSQGHVAAIRFKAFGDTEMWWVQATTPISRGNSGGGLFDENGDLIGLCDATLPRGENINLFVHPGYIKAFLEASSSIAGVK